MKYCFISPLFQQIDDYPYATLRADGCFPYNGLHCLSFPTLLQDVLHRFGYMGTRVPWLPILLVRAWMLQGPHGHNGSPL
jgi:hypothetical protein